MAVKDFLASLNSLTAEDLVELDKLIAAHDSEAAALRKTRKIVAERLGIPKATNGEPSERAVKMARTMQVRGLAVAFLYRHQNRPHKKNELTTALTLEDGEYEKLTNCPWFRLTSEGLILTEKGKEHAVKSVGAPK